MATYLNRVLVSKSNFRMLEHVLESMQEDDIELCLELLSGLDEKAAARFKTMEQVYGEYIDGITEISTNRDVGRIEASLAYGVESKEFLNELLLLLGPHTDSAKCSYWHDQEPPENEPTLFVYKDGRVIEDSE